MSDKEKATAKQGLYGKYILKKTNGKPIDPDARYFILRYDDFQKDENHRHASLVALQAYANEIEAHIPELAKDLLKILAPVMPEYGGYDRSGPAKQPDTTAAKLPTDEQIEKQANALPMPDSLDYARYRDGLIQGAKNMREQAEQLLADKDAAHKKEVDKMIKRHAKESVDLQAFNVEKSLKVEALQAELEDIQAELRGSKSSYARATSEREDLRKEVGGLKEIILLKDLQTGIVMQRQPDQLNKIMVGTDAAAMKYQELEAKLEALTKDA